MAKKNELPFQVGDRVRLLSNNRLYKVVYIDPEITGFPQAKRDIYLENDGRFLFTKGELTVVPVALHAARIGQVIPGGPKKVPHEDIPIDLPDTQKGVVDQETGETPA